MCECACVCACAHLCKCACVCTCVERALEQFTTAGVLMNEGIRIADVVYGTRKWKAKHCLGAPGNGASMVKTIKLPGLWRF